MKTSIINRFSRLNIATQLILLICIFMFLNDFIYFLGVLKQSTEGLFFNITPESVMANSDIYAEFMPKSDNSTIQFLMKIASPLIDYFINVFDSLYFLGFAFIIELYFRIADKMPAYMKGRKARKFAK